MKLRLPLAVLIFLAPLIARGGCQVPCWQPTLLTNRAAFSLVAIDVDDDGASDVAGITATSAFILRNDGSGKFAPPVDVYSGALRGTIVAGDFNGDGHGDLAFAREGAIVVLPGKDGGTFGSAIETTITIQPSAIAAARFTTTNTLDLAVVDATARKLVIFRGNGAGGFTEGQTSAIQPAATALTVADFDADSRNDVVVAYQAVNTFDAFYGRGDGTLEPALTIAAASDSAGLQAADLDGDGRPDLATVASLGPVAVIRNLGHRAFAAPLSYPLFSGTLLANLGVADLTRDGKPDVVMAAGCGLRTSSNAGDGTMTKPWAFEWQGCSVPFPARGGEAVADFDRDGRTDVIVSLPRQETTGDVLAFRNLCGDSTMTMTTDSPLIAAGQTVTVDVLIAPPTLDETLVVLPATGTVDQPFDTKPLAVSLSGGFTRFVIAGLTAGDHTLVADYAGDLQYDARQATLLVHVVSGIATTTTKLTADPPAGTFGRDVHLTATVTSSSGDTPTGPIHFTIDGNPTLADLHAPSATIYAGSLFAPGTHTFVAEFAGDATHTPSSATLIYTVDKQVPSMTAAPPFAVAGALDKGFDLDVDTLIGGGEPTGTITLRFGDTDLGTRSIKDANHQHFAFPAAGPGRYVLRVTYSGDASFAAVDTVIPFVIFPATPLSIDARGTDRGIVLTWNQGNGFARKRPGQDWSTSCCMNAPWIDDQVARETVYLYRASTPDGTTFSAADVAMLFTFTDDPLLPEKIATGMQVDEVVRATNLLRAAAGLAPISLTPGVRRRGFGASGAPFSFVAQLRDAINEAREKLGAYRFEFTTPAPVDTQINGAQLQELREATR